VCTMRALKQQEEQAKKEQEEQAKKQLQEEQAKKEQEEQAKKQQQEEQAKKEQEDLDLMNILETKIIPELKARCTKFPSWTSSQVERCLSFAEYGIEYDPRLFDIDDEFDENLGTLLADDYYRYDHHSRLSEQIVGFSLLVLAFFALIHKYSKSKWYPMQKFHFK
jgi:hypothetical protein